MLTEGTLTTGHAKAIVAISDAGTQIKVADEVVRKLLSVRQTEALVARVTAERAAGGIAAAEGAQAPVAAAEDPNVRAAQENLQRRLGTKVRIVRKGGGRGRIEVEFYSDEELDRLYTAIMRGH